MSVALYREDGLASSTAIKGPCRAATTANITLEGEQTIDGIACVSGDRVLVKNQSSAVENGIYIVDTGSWRRSADFEGNRDVRKGTRVAITDGSTNENSVWVVSTANPITIDSSSVSFVQEEAVAAAAEAVAAAAAAEEDRVATAALLVQAEAAQEAAEAALASVQALTAGNIGSIGWFAHDDIDLPWLEADGSAVSRTTYAALFAKVSDGFSAQTFTVTIASPAVFTKSSHGFTGGERVRLSTTSALPSGLDTSTDYYVKYINANTFSVASTFDGTAINTTGTQAGTHSYMQSIWGLGDGSTTFNLPALDNDERLIAAADSGRKVGVPRAESIGPHNHTATFTGEAMGNHSHSYTVYGSDIGTTGAADGGGGATGSGNTNGASAGTPAGSVTVNNNSGTVNLPPTIALRACVYTGVFA